MSEEPTNIPPSADEVAHRTIDMVLTLCRRGNRLGAGVLVITIAICGISYALGLAALDGGIRTVWAALGGFFGLLAIWAVVRAMWGLSRVSRNADPLLDEIRAMLEGDDAGRRTVIETVEVSEASQDESVVVMSRQFFTMQNELGPRTTRSQAITSALADLTKFPAFLLLAAMINLVFATLAILFLIGLAL